MIAFDLDDTIADTYDVLRTQIRERHGFDLNDLYGDGSINDEVDFRIPGLSRWCLLDTIADILSRYWTHIKPTPYAIEYLVKFYKKYGCLTIITARNPRVAYHTEMWLQNNLPVDVEHRVIFTQDKISAMNGHKNLVEDQPKYIRQCVGRLDCVFMPDRVWNKHVSHEKVIRVSTLKDVWEILENAS